MAKKTMLIKRRMICAAVITCCLCILGCSSVPKARITNVDSYTVAQTIYQYGNTRERRWPEPAVIHNNRKMTVKYIQSPALFNNRRCKDTIQLDVQQSNETVLSVKCEARNTNGVVGTAIDYYLGFLNPFYKRNHGRENALMINTTNQLQKEHQAQIEWLGKWRPDLL